MSRPAPKCKLPSAQSVQTPKYFNLRGKEISCPSKLSDSFVSTTAMPLKKFYIHQFSDKKGTPL